MSVDILNYMHDWTGNRAMAFRAYQMLREKYPQINEKTKVAQTLTKDITIMLSPDWRPMDDMLHVDRAGLKAVFYRAFGKLTGQQEFVDKGMEWRLNPAGRQPSRKTITVELWGWQIGVYDYRIALAYEPVTDTLYVYDRWENLLTTTQAYHD